MKRLKILLSAYACAPGKGSELGVGWNVACELAMHHDVWVITRSYNRAKIEQDRTAQNNPHLHFIYYDLPGCLPALKHGRLGTQWYYYLWQLMGAKIASDAHQRIGFDVAEHVTFVRCWSPSLLRNVPAPFIWGPVGGAERCPRPMLRHLSVPDRWIERLRDVVRWIARFDPFVRRTARRASLCVAITRDTHEYLESLGCQNIVAGFESGLSPAMWNKLSGCSVSSAAKHFISMGNLLYVKGFSLGLKAFARAAISGSTYTVVGDGPQMSYLRDCAVRCGIADKVRFTGELPRQEALDLLAAADVLVHPSLHDSGGWVCVEAMAAGRPVICLDTGGPGVQVTAETGIRVRPDAPEVVVDEMATAMRRLSDDGALYQRMTQAGRPRVADLFLWENRGAVFESWYEHCAGRVAAPDRAYAGEGESSG